MPQITLDVDQCDYDAIQEAIARRQAWLAQKEIPMKWHKLFPPVKLNRGDVVRMATLIGEFATSAAVDGLRITHVPVDLAPESLTVTRTDGTVERVEFDKEDTQ